MEDRRVESERHSGQLGVSVGAGQRRERLIHVMKFQNIPYQGALHAGCSHVWGEAGRVVSKQGRYVSDEGAEPQAGSPGHTPGSAPVTARTGTGRFPLRSQPLSDPAGQRPKVVSPASEPVPR